MERRQFELTTETTERTSVHKAPPGKRKRKRKRSSSTDKKGRHSNQQKTLSCEVSWWNVDTSFPRQRRMTSALASETTFPRAMDLSLFTNTRRDTITPEDLDPQKVNLAVSIWKDFSARKQEKKKTTLLTPSSVQRQSWSILLDTHRNTLSLIQQAPTGSGKTLAYGLPLVVNGIAASAPYHSLVVLPTRELAQQVALEIQRLIPSGHYSSSITTVALHGGVNKEAQQKTLQQAHQANVSLVLAATPGRLEDILVSDTTTTTTTTTTSASTSSRRDDAEQHNRFKDWYLCNCRVLVLDEADRLASQNDLSTSVTNILTNVFPQKSDRRLVLCSATWPQSVSNIWNQWLGERECAVVKMETIQVAPSTKHGKPGTTATDRDVSTLTNEHDNHPDEVNTNSLLSLIPQHVEQIVHVCADHKKPRKLLTTLKKILTGYISQRNKPRGMVFFAKISTLQYISKMLFKEHQQQKQKDSLPRCAILHGQLSQPVRDKALGDFRAGKCPLLLCTDVAARGIHVDNVQFVINYDFPGNLEQYVHRCGRAGRGSKHAEGPKAQVFSFFARRLVPMAQDLVALLQSTSQWVDPNLSALVKTRTSESNHVQSVTGKSEVPPSGKVSQEIASDTSDSDSDLRSRYAPNRITLKRASNV